MRLRWFGWTACALMLGGCQGAPRTPLPTVAQVDLQRFMGDWYVIANIPTFLEKGAHNAVDSYRLERDGTIDIRFTYSADGSGAERKTLESRGFVQEPSNAVWGVQFVWPFKADYRITYLAEDYSRTIVSRQKRDYVWIMARTPTIPDADYQRLVKLVGEQGYDIDSIQRVPQKWN